MRTQYHILWLATACTFATSAYAQNTQKNDTTLLPEIEVQGERPLNEQIGKSRLSSENIEQRQADNTATLLDILPGVSMSGSPRPSGQSLNIWGFGDSEDIKISLDGADKSFEKYRQGSVFIEPEILQQVTVDKGAFDPSRGNGGFGGQVRLETKSAADFLREGQQFGGLLKTSHHTNDEQWQHTGALYFRNASQTADGIIYVSDRRGNDQETPQGTRFLFSANQQRTYLLKLNHHPAENHMFTLSAIRGNHHGWEPFAAKRNDRITPPSAADVAVLGVDAAWRRRLVYRDQDDQTYSLKYRYTPANALINLTAQLTYARTLQHDKRPDNALGASAATLGNESYAAYSDLSFDVSNRSHFETGYLKHHLQVGLQSNHHKRDVWMFVKSEAGRADLNHGRYTPYYMPSGSQQQYAFYLQDEIRTGRWRITPALRYDHIRNTGRPNIAARFNNPDPAAGHDYRAVHYRLWSPSLGLTYQANDHILLFANIAQSWRAPVIDEQYEVQSANSSISGTSRNLKPERLISVRTGAIMDFKNLLTADDALQLRAMYYQLKGRDEIFKLRGIGCYEQKLHGGSISANCPAPVANNRNLPAYTIRGYEIEAYYDAPRWFASLSYSATSGYRQGSPRDPWHPGTTWLTDVAPRKATAMLGFKFPQTGVVAGWQGEFVRRQDRSPVDGDPMAGSWALPKSQGYALHGLFASYQPKQINGLTLRLTVDNVFNRRYAPYLGEQVSGVGRNVKFSASYVF